MNTKFQKLKTFNFNNATSHLWVFKSSASAIKYRAKFAQTDDPLNLQLKTFVHEEIQRITEFSSYSYISQTNENSCLSINVIETDFQFLKAQIDRLESENRAEGVKDLNGAKGYVVKFTHNGETVYAVKRSASNWKTAYPKKYINMIFSDGELTGVEDNSFSIEKNFDFYVVDNAVFISNKRGFESLMQYKSAYKNAFNQLSASQNFSDLFADITPLVEHVGSNSMHLRRMAVVEEKGIYTRPNFMTNLQNVNTLRNWGINFDPHTNKIIVCEATAKIILQVLLDHRLMSEITDNIYEVPEATQI